MNRFEPSASAMEFDMPSQKLEPDTGDLSKRVSESLIDD